MTPWRDRIKKHVRVRAGDLVPHPDNPRRHPEFQHEALEAVLDQVGWARSLLAYELPDGRYQLIDGHLRASLDAEQLVTVEVLDVNADEARVLLLSLDPLAALAEIDCECLEALRELTPCESEALRRLWKQIDADEKKLKKQREAEPTELPAAQWLILVTCRGEEEQLELLERFGALGLTCKPLIS